MSDAGSDNEEEQQYEIIYSDDSDKKKYSYVSRDGHALARFTNGDSYDGEYRGGKRNGEGVYTFSIGARYEGYYIDGKKDGKGTFTAPDGGKYIGDWKNDKRDGTGIYYYPNGDVYKGDWKNHLKHGDGIYYFGINGSSIKGYWSAGNLTYGSWSLIDGSDYYGQFFNNRLEGPGLFVFRSGNKLAGKFDKKGKFIHDGTDKGIINGVISSLLNPQSDEKKNTNNIIIDSNNNIITSSTPSPLEYALREIEKSVVKIDHFEGIYRLKKEFEGVPNYRRINDTHIYGSGQPSIDGFRQYFESIIENGADKIIWINMRNEPVLYINNNSYAPRKRSHLNENMELPGLKSSDINELEIRLSIKIKKQTEKRGGIHIYFKDTFAENPADRKNLELSEEVKELSNIRSVAGTYAMLEEEDYPVQYYRLPIVDEKAPSLHDFDLLTDILKSIDYQTTAVCFNCQMGKGRTTTGTVIAYLMKKVLEYQQNGGGDGGNGGRGEGGSRLNNRLDEDEDEENINSNNNNNNTDNKSPEKKETVSEYDPSDPSSYKHHGQYGIIMKLISALPSGESIKNDVDEAIDKCKAMQNLKEVIWYTKEMYDKETEDRRKFWQRMSINFIERYFYLILYYYYLKSNVDDEFQIPFSKWIQERPSLIEILGTRERGGLAEFQWK